MECRCTGTGFRLLCLPFFKKLKMVPRVYAWHQTIQDNAMVVTCRSVVSPGGIGKCAEVFPNQGIGRSELIGSLKKINQ